MHQNRHIDLLAEGLRVSCTGLEQFQAWIAAKLVDAGMRVDEFQVSSSELEDQPACRKMLSESPASLHRGPNVVGQLGDGDPEQGLLFFAHADKAQQSFTKTAGGAGPAVRDGRIYGPGIADDVAGIVAMLSAVRTFRGDGRTPLRRPLLCASILGKQLGVMGTSGLMKRYGPMANAVYVHPAESGEGLREIHITSNGLAEFAILIESTPPDTLDPFHAIYDRGAVNAADLAVALIGHLRAWESSSAARYHYPPLEEETGRSFAMLVSHLSTPGHHPVYQLPRACRIEGVICFPPLVGLETIRDSFETVFRTAIAALPPSRATLEWGDCIGEAGATSADSRLVEVTRRAIEETTGQSARPTYAYSISDIRYPLTQWGSQAIGIGPRCGALGEQDEWVDRDEYLDTISVLSRILRELVL